MLWVDPGPASGQRHGSVFLAFAVVDGEQHGLEIETVDAQIDALGQAQAAAVEEQNYEAVRRLQLHQNGFHLLARQNDRNVAVTLGPDDAVDLAKISVQNVAKEEEKRVKGLVL